MLTCHPPFNNSTNKTLVILKIIYFGSIIYMGVEKEIKKLYFKLSKLQNLNKLRNIVFLLHFV